MKKPGGMMTPQYSTHNGPLQKLINDSQNPYHAMHLNKAFEVKKPHLNKITGPEQKPLNDLGNPWLNMKDK